MFAATVAHGATVPCRSATAGQMTVPRLQSLLLSRRRVGLNTAQFYRRGHALLPSPLRRLPQPHGAALVPQCSQAGQLQYQSPFRAPQELQGLQRTAAGLSATAAKAGAALMVAVSAAIGAAVGRLLPEGARLAGQLVGGLLGAALAVLLVTKMKAARAEAAVTQLQSLLASKSDPSTLTRAEVEEVGARMGVDLASERVNDLQTLYGIFLESVIPKGEQPLSGNESEVIRSFKDALGLTDEDAAPKHLDVGRTLQRLGAEAGSREENNENRKTFQKLIFVSNLVFGDQKAAFLLPWRRVFNLTDAQLSVAKRDSAKALFKAFLDARGGKLEADRKQLAELKQYQQSVRLSDEVAEEMVKEAARTNIEEELDAAVKCITARTRERDFSDAVRAVNNILSFNRQMADLAGDAELVVGVGRTNVFGGKYDSASGEGKTRELRDLLKIYIEERLRQDGQYSQQLDTDLKELQATLGLGPKEVTSIRNDVVSAAYKRLLREEFKSGRLEEAPSKAAALEALCDRLQFDPAAAAAIHKGLYTERMETFLEDNKLTDDEAAELSKLRKLLCIGSADNKEIELATKGRIFKAALADAMGAGIDSFGFDDRNNVKAAREAVRLDEQLAKQILQDTGRKALMGFVTRSRNTRNRLDGAKELKKMVYFSNIVIAPLLEDMKTKEEREAEEKAVKAAADAAAQKKRDEKARREKANKELADLMAAAKAAADSEAAAEADSQQAATASDERQADAASPAEQEDKPEGREPANETSAPQASAEPASPAADAESKPEVEAVVESSSGETQPATLAKAQSAAAERAAGEQIGDTGMTMKSQKEVTLRDDLELRDRTDIYRNFLLYCMSGDQVALPMGSTVVVERDASEFARLAQLGDVLGLSPLEVNSVHTGLAEQSFQHQVQTVMGDGVLSKERSEALNEMRVKMGLSEEAAGKIIKGVQNQRLIGNLQATKAQGGLTLEKVLDMHDSGVDVDSFISADMRLQLYSKEVAKQLSSGTGEFDEAELLEDLPEKLQLAKGKVSSTIEGLAKDRKRTTLVQAISFLRQKKLDETTKSLNNLVACERVLPSDKPVSWDQKAELQDLYSTYISKESDSSKQHRVQTVLGISDSEADSLAGLVQSGQFKVGQEAEAESFF